MYATGVVVHISTFKAEEMSKEQLEEVAKQDGYFLLTWKKFQGREVLCGLYRFIFTVGLVIDIDETGYLGRYCFPDMIDAIDIVNNMPDELPDRIEDMKGNWIKFKGHIEVSNKNYQK